MAKKKTKKDNLVPVSLLEELMIEILLRLPVRSLLRFKCVCKSWLSLISDPQFTKSHFDLGAAPSYRLLYRTYDVVKYNSIDLETLLRCHPAEVILNFPRVDGIPLTVAGYCRGFMLMENITRDLFIFVIWNPFTGLQRRILRERIFKVLNICSPFVFGLGYDSSTDDYVIVIIIMSISQLKHIKVVECYSVRTNSWNCAKHTFAYHYDTNTFRHGLFLNGALHWIVRSDDNHRTIMAFDVAEKKFAGISLPHHVARSKSNKQYLRVTGGGHLCIVSVEVECYYQPHKFAEIWMMKQYKEQSSWTTLFVLSTDYYRHFSNFYPICFTENDEILGSDGDRTLVRLNNKGKLLDHRTRGLKRSRREGFPGCKIMLAAVYRESLLSLPGRQIIYVKKSR